MKIPLSKIHGPGIRVLGLILMVTVFGFLVVDNRNLGRDVERMALEIRQSQYEGCHRSNRKSIETNQAFARVYHAAEVLIDNAGGRKELLLPLKGDFGGLSVTNCGKAYPRLEPRK